MECPRLWLDWEEKTHKACCTDDCVHFLLKAVAIDHRVLRDLLDVGKVDIYIGFLNSFHIWVACINTLAYDLCNFQNGYSKALQHTGCNSSTSNSKLGSEAFQKPLILDEFAHTSAKQLLRFRLCWTVEEK